MSGVKKKMVTLEVHLPVGVVVETTMRSQKGRPDTLDLFNSFFGHTVRDETTKYESSEGVRLVLTVPLDKVEETAKLLRAFATELEKK